MQILGRPFTTEELPPYLHTLDYSKWRPTGICIHHTAIPSLSQRPDGFSSFHMANLAHFYGKQKGWSAGPHMFIDDHHGWVFTEPNRRGVHAILFNRTHLGLEMLGNYDKEDPWSGRGLAVLENTAAYVQMLLSFFGLSKSDVSFHRDDPKTMKTCPGKLISKPRFLALL